MVHLAASRPSDRTDPLFAISNDLRMVMTSRFSMPMTNWRGRVILSAPVSAPPMPAYSDCSSDGPLKPISASTVATRGMWTTPVPIATFGALQPPPLAFLPPIGRFGISPSSDR